MYINYKITYINIYIYYIHYIIYILSYIISYYIFIFLSYIIWYCLIYYNIFFFSLLLFPYPTKIFSWRTNGFLLMPDEKELFAQQLGQILEYAERLQDVDTTNVSENWQPVTKSSELRSDNCLPSLETETVLAKAPERGPHGLFRVPKVIG